MTGEAVPTRGVLSIDQRLQFVIEMLSQVGDSVEEARQEISESHDRSEEVPDTRNLQDLVTETRILRTDVKKRMDSDRRRMLTQTAFAIVLILCVLSLLLTAQQNATLIHRVEDCTSPTGGCYLERVRNSMTVDLVLVGQVATVECAKITRSDDELETCVRARVNAARGGR